MAGALVPRRQRPHTVLDVGSPVDQLRGPLLLGSTPSYGKLLPSTETRGDCAPLTPPRQLQGLPRGPTGTSMAFDTDTTGQNSDRILQVIRNRLAGGTGHGKGLVLNGLLSPPGGAGRGLASWRTCDPGVTQAGPCLSLTGATHRSYPRLPPPAAPAGNAGSGEASAPSRMDEDPPCRSLGARPGPRASLQPSQRSRWAGANASHCGLCSGNGPHFAVKSLSPLLHAAGVHTRLSWADAVTGLHLKSHTSPHVNLPLGPSSASWEMSETTAGGPAGGGGGGPAPPPSLCTSPGSQSASGDLPTTLHAGLSAPHPRVSSFLEKRCLRRGTRFSGQRLRHGDAARGASGDVGSSTDVPSEHLPPSPPPHQHCHPEGPAVKGAPRPRVRGTRRVCPPPPDLAVKGACAALKQRKRRSSAALSRTAAGRSARRRSLGAARVLRGPRVKGLGHGHGHGRGCSLRRSRRGRPHGLVPPAPRPLRRAAEELAAEEAGQPGAAARAQARLQARSVAKGPAEATGPGDLSAPRAPRLGAAAKAAVLVPGVFPTLAIGSHLKELSLLPAAPSQQQPVFQSAVIRFILTYPRGGNQVKRVTEQPGVRGWVSPAELQSGFSPTCPVALQGCVPYSVTRAPRPEPQTGLQKHQRSDLGDLGRRSERDERRGGFGARAVSTRVTWGLTRGPAGLGSGSFGRPGAAALGTTPGQASARRASASPDLSGKPSTLGACALGGATPAGEAGGRQRPGGAVGGLVRGAARGARGLLEAAAAATGGGGGLPGAAGAEAREARGSAREETHVRLEGRRARPAGGRPSSAARPRSHGAAPAPVTVPAPPRGQARALPGGDRPGEAGTTRQSSGGRRTCGVEGGCRDPGAASAAEENVPPGRARGDALRAAAATPRGSAASATPPACFRDPPAPSGCNAGPAPRGEGGGERRGPAWPCGRAAGPAERGPAAPPAAGAPGEPGAASAGGERAAGGRGPSRRANPACTENPPSRGPPVRGGAGRTGPRRERPPRESPPQASEPSVGPGALRRSHARGPRPAARPPLARA
ncbi:collagen alpha-1(I) chain-like [Hippopotamus amphibius kiboko]|uniref:collagen alpha-1(I) chain-like n=1 Tax=Hippopotamus amphibius kiboko TaxID=575201 RepID=UPI0025946FFF|nr:collagen alpha-1(I) chain-like [Hippopotamus amphibius kiboko]